MSERLNTGADEPPIEIPFDRGMRSPPLTVVPTVTGREESSTTTITRPLLPEAPEAPVGRMARAWAKYRELSQRARPWAFTAAAVGIATVAAQNVDRGNVESEALRVAKPGQSTFMTHRTLGIFSPSVYLVSSEKAPGPCDVVTAERVSLSAFGTAFGGDTGQYVNISPDRVTTVGRNCSYSGPAVPPAPSG